MDFPQDSPRYTSPKPGGGLYGDSYFMGKDDGHNIYIPVCATWLRLSTKRASDDATQWSDGGIDPRGNMCVMNGGRSADEGGSIGSSTGGQLARPVVFRKRFFKKGRNLYYSQGLMDRTKHSFQAFRHVLPYQVNRRRSDRRPSCCWPARWVNKQTISRYRVTFLCKLFFLSLEHFSSPAFAGDGSTHPADPWSSNGAGGAPLQPGPYGSYGGQQQPQSQQQQQVGPTPPLMNSGPNGGAGPNTHMGQQQQPSYPGQGIFSKSHDIDGHGDSHH